MTYIPLIPDVLAPVVAPIVEDVVVVLSFVKASNLSDIPNAGTARSNLGVTTTANLSSSTNKNFVTDAQLTVIGNTSGTNTGDQSLAGLQPLDSDLTTIAGLTATTDSFMQAKSSAWASRTVAQVKTDLGLTGTNSGDQTSIAGITGTTAQFNTALTDGDFATGGGTATGTNTGDQTISDATISTSDITTNNASASKHGFCPKLSNVATEFLNGTGAFSTPAGGPGGAPTYTDFTKDLGVAKRSGTFDITGLSGLTTNKVVSIVQTAAQIASKGNARDEPEMDLIRLTGYVVDASTIRAYWNASGVVVGTYAFAFMVSG